MENFRWFLSVILGMKQLILTSLILGAIFLIDSLNASDSNLNFDKVSDMVNQDQASSKETPRVWEAYYSQFPDINPDAIRKGCEPLIFDWGEKRKHSIVLIHGLSDSPYFMRSIGRYFHEQMGFNVFLPLLQSHGLKEPNGMEGVSLKAWKENINFSISEAKKPGDVVSIGGLSTGGALSVQAALEGDAITGSVFLFSAALKLAGSFGGFKAWLLRTPVADVFDFYDDTYGKPLIGDHPYRYSRVDKGAAKHLGKLMKEITELTAQARSGSSLIQPFFIAHSEADKTASISGVEELLAVGDPQKTDFFRMGKHFQIPHSSVVLEEPAYALNGSPLEPANPFFAKMMAQVHTFSAKNLGLETSAKEADE